MNNFLNRNHENKKIVDYFQKVQDRLQSLNQMKSQLGSYKVDQTWHKTMVKKEKQKKPDLEIDHDKPKNIMLDSSSDSSDRDDKIQQ